MSQENALTLIRSYFSIVLSMIFYLIFEFILYGRLNSLFLPCWWVSESFLLWMTLDAVLSVWVLFTVCCAAALPSWRLIRTSYFELGFFIARSTIERIGNDVIALVNRRREHLFDDSRERMPVVYLTNDDRCRAILWTNEQRAHETWWCAMMCTCGLQRGLLTDNKKKCFYASWYGWYHRASARGTPIGSKMVMLGSALSY